MVIQYIFTVVGVIIGLVFALLLWRVAQLMKDVNKEVVPIFFFSSRRRHTRCYRDWSSDVCSSDLTRLNSRRRHTRCYRDWSSDVCGSISYAVFCLDRRAHGRNPVTAEARKPASAF